MVLLCFASHSGKNISKLWACESLYFLAIKVTGHTALKINRISPSIAINPKHIQTHLSILLEITA